MAGRIPRPGDAIFERIESEADGLEDITVIHTAEDDVVASAARIAPEDPEEVTEGEAKAEAPGDAATDAATDVAPDTTPDDDVSNDDGSNDDTGDEA